MTIDVYTSTGTKKGTMELPPALFDVEVNTGLMHEALVRQQSNRRNPIAHVKTRSEVIASTKKLYQQKGTGRARRGSANANLLKGGAKAFGPRNERNFVKNMPRAMRRNALFSCLTTSARAGRIIGLDPTAPAGSAGQGEGLLATGKTKDFVALLVKLPVSPGRKIVFVLPSHSEALERGARNVPGVKTILAQYLNPEDVLGAHHLVFLVEAIKVAEETFARKRRGIRREEEEEKNGKKGVRTPSKASSSSSHPL